MRGRLLLPISAVYLAGVLAFAQTAPASSQAAASAAQRPSPAGNLSTAAGTSKEDWTALSLDKSGLNLAGVTEDSIGKWEKPEYTRELLRVQWRPNDPIDLYVIRPHGVEKPPVILYLYGFPSDTERFRDEGWSKRVTQGGFAAVGFVSALTGQRIHTPRPMRDTFVTQLQESLGTSTHDVQMVLNYLASRGDLDMKSVGMFGQGSGATTAILAAQADSRIVALDLLDPWGDWPDWLRSSPQVPEDVRADYLKPEFLARISQLDPIAYLPHLKLKALRIQQVLDDPDVPASVRDKVAAAVPRPEQVVRYKDTQAHIAAYRASGLTGWLREQLRPSPAEKKTAELQADLSR